MSRKPQEQESNGISLPRAEEIIVEVYRQLHEGLDAGTKPNKVVMPRTYWNVIEEYRRFLGPLEGSLPDYLSEDSLFGLEIWYGNNPEIRVE